MKISVCMNTAHDDYCMSGFPDLHLFEYTMAALRKQTFKDFEVVIADVLYDQRSGYFEFHPEVFPINHVSIKPNVWTSRGQVAISTTKNTCLLHAKGEIIVFVDDSVSFNENYLQDIINQIQPNICISNPYEGWLGDKFIGKDQRKVPDGPVGGTYGNIAAYLDKFLDVNGYEEFFDGSRGLEDCDFSLRLSKSGVKIYLINNYATYQQHKAYPTLTANYAKCARLSEVICTRRMNKGIYIANSIVPSNEEISIITSCAGKLLGARCPHVPFPCPIMEDGKCYSGVDQKLVNLYSHPSMFFSIREQRKDVDGTIRHLRQICEGE